MKIFGSQTYLLILIAIVIFSFIAFRKAVLHNLEKNSKESKSKATPLKRKE